VRSLSARQAGTEETKMLEAIQNHSNPEGLFWHLMLAASVVVTVVLFYGYLIYDVVSRRMAKRNRRNRRRTNRR